MSAISKLAKIIVTTMDHASAMESAAVIRGISVKLVSSKNVQTIVQEKENAIKDTVFVKKDFPEMIVRFNHV